MKKITFIILIGILCLSSRKQNDEQEYIFEDVQIYNSNYYLMLPAGIIENKVDIYAEGFYQDFIYSDKSVIVILRGGNAGLDEPKIDNHDIHSRLQSVDGIQMIYGNVKTERKAEFDKAFDLMKQQGLKKK